MLNEVSYFFFARVRIIDTLVPFCVIGNSLEFPITQKGANVPMMRTHTKQKYVASDRARRPNVPENILYAQIRVHKLKQYQDKKQQK